MFDGFSKDGIELLKEIAACNTKEYFLSQEERYKREILQPNRAYIKQMGEYLQILEPNLHAEPKVNRSLFKIYRDSRFHLDRPIKEKIGIIIWQGGGHRMQSSSFYMHYAPDGYFVAAGIRWFKPPLLKTYREYLQKEERREALHTILQTLKQKGYSLPEPKYKRYPSGCKADETYSYLYLHDSMYAYKKKPLNKTFFSRKIVNSNFKIYQDMFDLHQWVYMMTLYGEK